MAVNGINSIGSVLPGSLSKDKIQVPENEKVSFADFLKQAIEKTNDLQIESQKITEGFAAGKSDNIAQVMIAAEKADIAFQFTMQIRNKILDAYNEIMRMQI